MRFLTPRLTGPILRRPEHRLTVTALMRTLKSPEGAYFASFNLTNALNYAYLAGMGLFLTSGEYGLFVALFGVIYLLSALGNTVQVATATHIARLHAARGGVSVRDLAIVGAPALAVTAGLVSVLLGATPFLSRWFDTTTAPLLWAYAAAALSVLLPSAYGVLQGMQRFVPLGMSQLMMAGSRTCFGFAFAAAGLGPAGALAGVALGYIPSGLMALVMVTRNAQDHAEPARASVSLRSIAVTFAASVAIAAPTSLDVALANHFLTEMEAGAYAAMAVIGRVILFLPLAISFVILPKAASDAALSRETPATLMAALSSTLLLAIGSAVVLLGVAHLGWTPVGGDIEVALGALPWYLLAMIAFTTAVPAIYYRLGRGDVAFLVLLVPAIAAQAGAVLVLHDSVTAIAQALFAINLALAAVMIASSLWLHATPRPARIWRFG